MKSEKGKREIIAFAVILLAIISMLAASFIKTNAYNSVRHFDEVRGAELFSPEESDKKGVTIVAVPRSSTWTKVFDLENEGLTEHNYQAYTYDFTISNDTPDEVNEFIFTLTFSREVYLMSAWNGALEIHQKTGDGEIVDTVPDLREYNPEAHKLRYVTVDGESLIQMNAGDYLVYMPSSTMNALEVPIEPQEATTPGIILYVAIGESIKDSYLSLEYTFNRLITSEPLFWISIGLLALWFMTLVILLIINASIAKFQERHERDNEIINESIETFTGFIDAKDPYTNGHSKRVAIYTKRLAKEFGYEGEELDRVYYIALLHDCGKIGVPDSILTKPGKLTDEEYEILKSHSARGAEILSSFKSLKDVEAGAHYHHERYDGKGYPDGLKGEEIPFIARMICVADSFDAMNSNRVYRKKLPREKIISELEENKGKQFDPEVADVMLRLIREGQIPIGK
ncbi:MAG: HD-GYP domain-containing protein [Oscillospiraceae bacterium]|nr:HD-GYP domain-containing protein [Oscillospiraceae bacterium]